MRVEIVPRSIPRFFEKEGMLSRFVGLAGRLGRSVPVAPDCIQSQVGFTQGSFHFQIGIRVSGSTFCEAFLGAFAGGFGTLNIYFFDIFGRICQDGTMSGWTSATPPATVKISSFPPERTLIIPILRVVSRGVVRQDAHFAVRARKDHNICIALVDDAVL